MAAVAVDLGVVNEGVEGCDVAVKHRTVTVLDWDDTILASTVLQVVGEVGSKSPEVREAFLELEWHALGLLEEALKVGSVIIVTNAEAGWVEMSAASLMPKVLQFLMRNHIRIVSARSLYGAQYPTTPLAWKLCTFIGEMSLVFGGIQPEHILVLGDGIGECLAARELQRMLPETRVKIIKFVEYPSISKLIEEQTVIRKHLQYVAKIDRSFEKKLP